MAYRDDVDALFYRATTLQQELDSMRAKLDERDRELATLRGTKPRREDTSPGMRALRNGPELDALMQRLVDRDPSEVAIPDPPRARRRDAAARDPTPLSSYLAIDTEHARTPATAQPPPTPFHRVIDQLAGVSPRHLEQLTAIVAALAADSPRPELVHAIELAAMLAR